MYKGRINADATVLANTNVPFTTVFNTNSNTTPDGTNNNVRINKTGYYDIYATIKYTDVVASPVEVNIIADGNIVASATADVTADTGIGTLTIIDVERVAVAPIPDRATISVQFDGSATILAGSQLIIESRK